MKEFYAVSRYKKLLSMRWLILTAEKKNVDLLGSVKEKKCPICNKQFKNIFFLQRHLDTTKCGTILEKTLRSTRRKNVLYVTNNSKTSSFYKDT